eukprot:205243-Amphidinium_carterae.1
MDASTDASCSNALAEMQVHYVYMPLAGKIRHHRTRTNQKDLGTLQLLPSKQREIGNTIDRFLTTGFVLEPLLLD